MVLEISKKYYCFIKMLFLYGERLFDLVPSTECEDIGIETMRIHLTDSWFYQLLTWLPLAFALASIDQVGYHLSKGNAVLSFSTKSGVSIWIVFGWVFFTLMSLLTLLLFGRAPISYAMKFAHVGFELMHLIKFFWTWGWSSHALLVFILAVFSFFATLNMPCEVAHSLTSLGVVLDTANFILCAFVPNKSFSFQLLTGAFFLHASYIWSFLLMVNLHDPVLILLLRSYGVYANSFAILLGCWSILSTTLCDEYGSVQACRSLVVKQTADSTMTAKGKKNLFILHDRELSEFLIPSTETYFPSDASHTLFMHLLCVSGSVARFSYNTLRWMDFEQTEFETIATEVIIVQRPTPILLFAYRILNWAIFITLLHTLTDLTQFLPSVILSWIPWPFFTFLTAALYYRCI